MADKDQYYRFGRPEVAALVPAGAKRILDIGCGAGLLGYQLKQRQDCWVSGIEIAAGAAEQARSVLDEVLVGDVESLIQIPPSERFDCIICADVLEHLRDPGRLLRALREHWLQADGIVVASVPNVRHWSVLRQVLEGGWDYADAGLLDHTHLRFFTRKTLYQLFAEEGFQILNWGTTEVMGETLPKNILTSLQQAGLRVHTLEQESKVYQYLLTARPKPLPVYRSVSPGVVDVVSCTSAVASVVIPVWNQVEYTRQCVESLLDRTHTPFELIIVDNGSTDGTGRYLEELQSAGAAKGCCLTVRVIHNQANVGFGQACNQGMAEAVGDYLVLLNNDTVVSDGWLERMIAAAERDSAIGVVGPRSNYVAGPQVIPQVPYQDNDLAGMERFAAYLAATRKGRGFLTTRAIGLCLLIKRRVIACVGGFDPRFGLGNFEDDDFSIRVLLAGFSIWIADDVYIHHYGSRTFSGQKLDYAALLQRNMARFQAKWAIGGGEPQAGYSLQKILRDHVFSPEEHYEPLTPAELDQPMLEPLPLQMKRSLHFLAIPRWDDPDRSWLGLIEKYVKTFSSSDDVLLLLRVDPEGPVPIDEVVTMIQEGARENGINLDGGPDILLVNDHLSPSERGRLYQSAHVLVAPELADGFHITREALYFGLTVQGMDEAFTGFCPAKAVGLSTKV